MKVARFGLERTEHSHFFTPKTSSWTRTFMSCLTATWQERRSPSAASRFVISEVSVARIEPPPSRTLTRHCPQVPPPPQAEGTRILPSPSAPNSFCPTGVSMIFSSLMVILTFPAGTNCDLAARMTRTRPIKMAVNTATPRPISSINASSFHIPEKARKARAIKPVVIKVIPRPWRPSGTSLYFNFSRTPASATIASAQPTPLPMP